MTTNPPAFLLPSTRRGRGRPPISTDNLRAREFVRTFVSAYEMCETFPRIDDVLEAAVQAQTKGEGRTRPLSRRTLFLVLQCCSVIDTASVAEVLTYASPSTVRRYTAAARVASMFIAELLDGHLGWVLTADRWALDTPSPEELKALSLLI